MSGLGGKGGKGAPAGRGHGLLVAHFDPGAGQASQDSVKKKAKIKEGKQGDQPAASRMSDVNPAFARVFRGGPKRGESDLPVQEDEGLQEIPKAPDAEAAGNGGGVSWLTSLLGIKAEEPSSAVSELGWLGSLKASASGKPPRVKEELEQAEMEAPATSLLGKALPIPPFWRLASEEEMEEALRKQRPAMLLRIRRLAKDARRAEQRRGGRLKTRSTVGSKL
mmetsp:Transcript_49494/g.80256  ORF Transcript_49494/g.80256 Transcript_49494/m.80256 type:complete len:222 (+) Transcript_49494:106-771(+)